MAKKKENKIPMETLNAIAVLLLIIMLSILFVIVAHVI